MSEKLAVVGLVAGVFHFPSDEDIPGQESDFGSHINPIDHLAHMHILGASLEKKVRSELFKEIIINLS